MIAWLRSCWRCGAVATCNQRSAPPLPMQASFTHAQDIARYLHANVSAIIAPHGGALVRCCLCRCRRRCRRRCCRCHRGFPMLLRVGQSAEHRCCIELRTTEQPLADSLQLDFTTHCPHCLLITTCMPHTTQTNLPWAAPETLVIELSPSSRPHHTYWAESNLVRARCGHKAAGGQLVVVSASLSKQSLLLFLS